MMDNFQKNRVMGYVCIVLVLGHLFDFLIGLDTHHWFAPFKVLTDIYGQWDPLYVEQPFYVKVVAILSGFVMVPLAALIAYSYFQNRPNYPLILFYGGFVTCNNLAWMWNEYYSHLPPSSWLMIVLCAGLWFFVPPWMAIHAYRQLRRTE